MACKPLAIPQMRMSHRWDGMGIYYNIFIYPVFNNGPPSTCVMWTDWKPTSSNKKIVDSFCSYPAKSVHFEYSLEKLWEISFPQNSFLTSIITSATAYRLPLSIFELGRMTQTKASDQTRNHLTVVLHKGLQHEIWFSKALVGLSQGWESIHIYTASSSKMKTQSETNNCVAG